MTILTDIIAWEQSHLGLGEDPDGSNHNWVTVEYGLDPGAWCDMFQSVACKRLTGSFAAQMGKFAWTISHATAYKNAGRWGTIPKIGAHAFFDWQGGKSIDGIDHIELVVGNPLADGRIPTIGANVDNRVKALLRSPKYIVGYGYPIWCDEVAPAPIPVPVPVPPATNPFIGRRLLYMNCANGSDVTALQWALIKYYPKTSARFGLRGATGHFGPVTNNVVKVVQSDYFPGERPDGKIGPRTRLVMSQHGWNVNF